MEVGVTQVFKKNNDASRDDNIRFIVNQGGARSSKTYSILQVLISKVLEDVNKEQKIIIARKTLPSLRDSVLLDFFDILKTIKVFNINNFNKQTMTYSLFNTDFKFLSVDDPEKKKGIKSDFVFMNEANEFSYDDFFALNIRAEKKVYLDYNPNFEFSWIYDDILKRPDHAFIQSTYKDNYFISSTLRDEIEATSKWNPQYYKVFGLGERGVLDNLVFSHFTIADRTEDVRYNKVVYGVDFGYNNATAIVKCGMKEKNRWDVELLSYKTKVDNELLKKEIESLEIDKNSIIFTDHDPEKIDVLRGMGYNVYMGNKDVYDGIQYLKTQGIEISAGSSELIKELKGYCWKKLKDGRLSDEPVKLNDHAVDAMRYAIYSYYKQFAQVRRSLVANY